MASARTTSQCLLSIYHVPRAVLSPGHPLSLTVLFSPRGEQSTEGRKDEWACPGGGEGGREDANPSGLTRVHIYHADGFCLAPRLSQPRCQITGERVLMAVRGRAPSQTHMHPAAGGAGSPRHDEANRNCLKCSETTGWRGPFQQMGCLNQMNRGAPIARTGRSEVVAWAGTSPTVCPRAERRLPGPVESKS